MEENKQQFDLGEPWAKILEAAVTMSAEEFEKYFTENYEWKAYGIMSSYEMGEITMPTRWERVKQHVVRNRYWYAAGGLAVVAGALGYSIGRSSADGECGHTFEVGDVNAGEDVVIGGDHIDNSQIHNEINNYYGHSTKIVKCLETGEIWETVNEAADAIGVARSTLSNHLNGRSDHIYGNHYEIIGQGTTGV